MDEVIGIHDCLVADFAGSADPISPAGLRSRDLLESAVARQHVGFEHRLKYDTPHSNAATLAYGLCLNHPFHNGNKRISLVALLCHLDRNELTFDENVSQGSLYAFMLNVARHFYGKRGIEQPDPDQEVAAMTRWIRERTRRIETGERLITFRQLKQILRSYAFELENPSGNSIQIVRYEIKTFFGLPRRKIRHPIFRMGNPGDGIQVSRNELRAIRRACNLTDSDGVDSHTFYSASQPLNYFINRYRGTLDRLAKT